MKKEKPAEPHAANIYKRPKRIQVDQFLLFVPGRDTDRFAAEFAVWLAERCSLHLVRLCFEEELHRQQSAWGAKLVPARFHNLTVRISKASDPVRRQRLIRQRDRQFPAQKRDAVSKELARRSQAFRAKYVADLVGQLRTRRPAAQIKHLNRHLKERKLLPPPLRLKPATARKALAIIPKDLRRFHTVHPPQSIALDEVQDEYYRQHPELRRDDAKLQERTFARELGGEAARRMASPQIPHDAFWLQEIAHALACVPNLSKVPPRRWQGLFSRLEDGNEFPTAPLRNLLKSECASHPQPLHEFATNALGEQLAWMRCDRQQIGCFKNDVQVHRLVLAAIKRIAAGDKARADRYHLIYWLALHTPDLVEALRGFFFHGLPLDVMRTHPGLYAKLLPALQRQDIPRLLKFLFQSGNKKCGLIPQWMIDDEPQSAARLDHDLLGAWPWLVRQHRLDIPERDTFETVEALSGMPPARTPDLKLARLRAFAKRRERLGLLYPK